VGGRAMDHQLGFLARPYKRSGRYSRAPLPPGRTRANSRQWRSPQ
jgi:hypothetical protein